MPGVDYSRFDRLVAEDTREEEQWKARRREEDKERARQGLERRHRQELEALQLAEEEECQRRGRGSPARAAGGPPEPQLRRADRSGFERLDAPEEEQSGARRREEDRERAKHDLERRRQQELESLRLAEKEECQKQGEGNSPRAACGATGGSSEAQLASVDFFEKVDEEEIQSVDVDDFFRPPTDEEKAERARLHQEKEDRRRQREEAAGQRPLRNEGLTPEQIQERVEKVKADRIEMVALMDRCDRPAVKARLSDFLVEMDNDLARLQEDPLELDDEDRRELRLFHLRKMQLPGAVRTRREFDSETMYLPKALGPADCKSAAGAVNDEPWHEVSTFTLDLGLAGTPVVTVDVRIEAVERLPTEAVSCHFQSDGFDLRIRHCLVGRGYRLLRRALQREIVPELSSFHTRRNHVIVQLAKRDSSSLWTDLCVVDKPPQGPLRGWARP